MKEEGAIYIMETFWDNQRTDAGRYSSVATSLYFTCIANGESQMYHSQDMFSLIEKAGLKVEKIVAPVGISHTLIKCKSHLIQREIYLIEMKLEEINILDILPQRPPFIMIDRLLQCDVVVTETEWKVCKENLFVEGNTLLESGLIENMAQTCAARMGYLNTIVHPGIVKLGFIGSIRNLSIHRSAKSGELLQTRIRMQSEVFNIILVQASIHINGELIAECEMKISEQ